MKKMTVEISSAPWVRARNWRSLLIYNSDSYTPAIQKLLSEPDNYLQQAIRYFKNDAGDTSTVGLIKIEDKLLIIKRYNIKNVWHGLKLWFRPSRAMTSWENIFLLKSLNVTTANPIAILEKRFGPLRRQAYFIYEYVDGVMCFDYFENIPQLTPLFKTALQSVAETLKIMRQHFIYHGDFHHKNMVIYQDKVILLDLDHMKKYRFFKWRFKKLHQRDIDKFLLYLGKNEEAKNYFKGLIK